MNISLKLLTGGALTLALAFGGAMIDTTVATAAPTEAPTNDASTNVGPSSAEAGALANTGLAVFKRSKREPAGQFVHICVLANGHSYRIRPGAALNTCNGSYIQHYIGGRLVQVIKITGYPPTVRAGRQ